MYAPTPMAMTTQAATAAPAIALAGMTPLVFSGCGACGATSPPTATTAPEGVGVGLVDRVPVAVVLVVAVAVPVPVPVAAALEDATGVGASPDPDPVPVGVPVA
jgi:hypothetical protein